MKFHHVVLFLGLAGVGCSAETCGHTEKAIESAGEDVERNADKVEAEAKEAYDELKTNTARGVEVAQ